MALHQNDTMSEDEQLKPRRSVLTIFAIIMFLCILTAGEIYLLYSSTQSGKGKTEVQNIDETRPVGDFAVTE